ncbi:MAG: LptA/OstA family protein [Allosphingosinicella sp.]
MKRLFPLLLLAALGPAAAYGQVSALKGHDSDAPVDVVADRIEVQDRADRAIFTGNVVVSQGQLTLTAPRLTVAYSGGGGVQLRRIDASGGVTVKSPSETARGNIGIYDTQARIITLIGDVSLVQRDANVNGGRLVIDLDSGRAVMDGGGPPGTSRQGGRVTGRFTVPQRNGS